MLLHISVLALVSFAVGYGFFLLAREREDARKDAAKLALTTDRTTEDVGLRLYPDNARLAEMAARAATEARLLNEKPDPKYVADAIGSSVREVREDAVAWSIEVPGVRPARWTTEWREGLRAALIAFASLVAASLLWSQIERWLNAIFL